MNNVFKAFSYTFKFRIKQQFERITFTLIKTVKIFIMKTNLILFLFLFMGVSYSLTAQVNDNLEEKSLTATIVV